MLVVVVVVCDYYVWWCVVPHTLLFSLLVAVLANTAPPHGVVEHIAMLSFV